MTNELALPNQQKFDVDVFTQTTKSNDYLPRIQLMSSACDKCKSGEFPINHYALVRDQNFQDIGTQVDVAIIAWRPKALEIGEEVVSIFDPKSPEWKRISDRALTEQNSGCMFGPEFLVYIPSIKDFATLFMGSKTARREAPALLALLTKPATLKSRLIEGKKHKWQAVSVTPCSTPFDLPDLEKLKMVVEKFNNPPATTVEVAEEGAERAR